MYRYEWLPGKMVPAEDLKQMADLYSNHYGKWGQGGRRPGKSVSLSSRALQEDWLGPESSVYYAKLFDQIVGYAIAARTSISGFGSVAWVTQLVVHEEHRQRDVAKKLLFSSWGFTNIFAWGLLSANPFAVRALEKATRRRCVPYRISESAGDLLLAGKNRVAYLPAQEDLVVTASESRANTKFFLDHSKLPEMLKAAVSEENPWLLGSLPEGWEWFAFTFKDQPQIGLTQKELADMLTASDEVTRHAYSRMPIGASSQAWAQHARPEADFIIEHLSLTPGSSLLDLGCGIGRHSLELASKGFKVTGVDYIKASIVEATAQAHKLGYRDARFIRDDCRTVALADRFDGAICVYDVVGSYADDAQNLQILTNLEKHLNPGALALVSVMNMELTAERAKNWFSISLEADRLLALEPSKTMEHSGNVFDPDYYMIEKQTGVVYRKEQFEAGTGLPEELIVRDRRYTASEIGMLCQRAGLEVIWSRYVRAGHWHEEEDSDRAKEILVLCRKSASEDLQISLF